MFVIESNSNPRLNKTHEIPRKRRGKMCSAMFGSVVEIHTTLVLWITESNYLAIKHLAVIGIANHQAIRPGGRRRVIIMAGLACHTRTTKLHSVLTTKSSRHFCDKLFCCFGPTKAWLLFSSNFTPSVPSGGEEERRPPGWRECHSLVIIRRHSSKLSPLSSRLDSATAQSPCTPQSIGD